MNSKNAEYVVQELAAGLRDVIREAPVAYLESDPENAFKDLACRFVFRLRETLAIVPADQCGPNVEAEAALRIFNILTTWMRAAPGRIYTTGFNSSGKFEIVVKEADKTRAYFQGGSIQDAYAQAAQTINFNGGTL